MLAGLEEMAPPSAVQLGFQAHFPQLETKLAARAADAQALDALLAPLEAAIRERMGRLSSPRMREDAGRRGDRRARRGTLAVVETLTGGGIAQRLVQVPRAATRFRRGLVLPPPAADGAGAVAEAAALRAAASTTMRWRCW